MHGMLLELRRLQDKISHSAFKLEFLLPDKSGDKYFSQNWQNLHYIFLVLNAQFNTFTSTFKKWLRLRS